MTRSFVPILLFIGSALASVNPLLFPRQTTDLPECTKSCLVTYGTNTPCKSVANDETKFVDCMCKDNSAAATTLLSCVKSCSQTEQQDFAAAIQELCKTSTGTGTPSASGSSKPTSAPGTPTGAPSKTGTATSSAPTPTASHPCAEKCYATYLGKTSCKPDDAECICSDESQEAKDLITCVKACPAADVQYFSQAADDYCKNVGATTTSSGTAGTTKTSGGSNASGSGSATSTASATTTTKTTTKASTPPAATGNAAAPGATGSFVAMVGGLLAAVLAL